MEEQVKEEKKLTGLAAYHEKQRLEKEGKKGLKIEESAVSMQGTAVMEAPAVQESEVPKKPAGLKIDPNKTYHFMSVVKSNTARNEMIGNTCKVLHEGRVRQIMYIPFADTIWVDEMGDRYKGVQPAVISIYNNILDVPGTDARLVEYLIHHDQFAGNPSRISRLPALFTLQNMEDIERAKEDRFTAELRAMNLINEVDIKELLPLSRVVFNIIETDSLTVKNRLREWAKKDPSKIINNIDNPRVMRQYLIQAALDHNVLDFNSDKGHLLWGGTKTYIMDIHSVKDNAAMVREIADYTFTEDGSKLFNILKQKISV